MTRFWVVCSTQYSGMTRHFSFWFVPHQPFMTRVAAAVDCPGSLSFKRHTIPTLPPTLALLLGTGQYVL